MSIFNRRDRQSRGPGAQYNRDGQSGIVHRPLDEPIPEESAASTPPPAPQPAPETAQNPPAAQPPEKPLSYTGIDFEGHGTLVLYQMREDDAPKRIEEILATWQSLPEGSQFDVMALPAEVYCFNKQTGEILSDVIPEEELRDTIIEKQAKKIKKRLAELTGEKPVDPAAADLAKTLGAMSKEQLFDVFNAMDGKALCTMVTFGHKVIDKRGLSKSKQPGSGEQSKTGGPKPQPAPAPRPQPTASGKSGGSMAGF